MLSGGDGGWTLIYIIRNRIQEPGGILGWAVLLTFGGVCMLIGAGLRGSGPLVWAIGALLTGAGIVITVLDLVSYRRRLAARIRAYRKAEDE